MTWRDHTKKFDSRVDAILPKNGEIAHEFTEVPNAPFSQPLSKKANTYWLAATVAIGAYRSAIEHRAAFCESWRAGRFLVAAICTRALIELWGTVEYLITDIHEKAIMSGDIDAAARKVQRLSLGAKSSVPMPWGGNTQLSPINVMDFVRAADNVSGHAMVDYEWLCDASHPSFFQHLYLSMAGATLDNWTNATFARHADEMLDRLLVVAETSVSHQLAATKAFAGIALPIILSSSATGK